MSIYGDKDKSAQYDPRERRADITERMECGPIERVSVNKMREEYQALKAGLGATTSPGVPEMERVVKDMEDAIQTLGMTIAQLRERLQPVLIPDFVDVGKKEPGQMCQSELGSYFESRAITIRGSVDVLRNIIDRLAI